MIEVAALTSGVAVPSARFRVRQYIPYLKTLGIGVEELCPPIDKYAGIPGVAGRFDSRLWLPPVHAAWMGMRLAMRIPGLAKSYRKQVVWLEREFQPGLPTLEWFVKKPFIFDVDDAIWEKPPFGSSLAIVGARRAHTVVAGNTYIADWFSNYTKNIEIVPTAVDVERYHPSVQKGENERQRFVIGWIGTSSGFRYLEHIAQALKQFVTLYPDVELCVVADRAPQLSGFPEGKLRFVQWSEETEVTIIQQFAVGIMPLLNDSWSRGKCAFKMLQYMATGLPVIASPIGTNVEVMQEMDNACFAPVSTQDWCDALEVLYWDPELRSHLGKIGRRTVERKYSASKISVHLADIFLRAGSGN